MDTPLSNLTPRAHQVLAFARKEAARLRQHFVGTEHLLLGLVLLGQGVACNVLKKKGLDLESVREAVEKQVGPGPDAEVAADIPYTPGVKRVMAMAQSEATALQHTYVGTEHLLLGLLREGDGVAARVLTSFEVDAGQTRLEILKELDPNSERTVERAAGNSAQPNPHLPKPRLETVDTSKRYDVYCREQNQQTVVYRNVLFMGRSKLLSTGQHDLRSEFLKVEQPNGQIIYLSMFSVIKLCEHGVEMGGESIS